jgi:probable H4MPT-linked C1 transfer pathway protein
MIFGIDIRETSIKITSLKANEHLKAKSIRLNISEKEDIIETLIFYITDPDLVVVTQTICVNRQYFSTAKEGTHYIVDLTERLFGDNVRYVGLSYSLLTPEEAKSHYLKVASRTWVATCYLASPFLNVFENGLVIDCGTNSTDIVPVIDAAPVTLDDDDRGYTRLKTGELLWSGLYFTHVPSLSTTVVLDSEEFQINPSTRAMSFDIYTLLGMITPEAVLAEFSSVEDRNLFSSEASMRRMINVISADRELLGINDAKKIAAFFAEKQKEKIEKAIKKVLSTTKKKYGKEIKTAAIAGAGKDIILRDVLKDLAFEEIIDIEKAASETLDMTDAESNCETSLGCALMGLHWLTR